MESLIKGILFVKKIPEGDQEVVYSLRRHMFSWNVPKEAIGSETETKLSLELRARCICES